MLLLAIALGTGAIFASFIIARGIQASTEQSFARMGADLIVVPAEAMVNITSALLTVQPTDATFDDRVLEAIVHLDGVAQAAPQTIYHVPIMAGMPGHQVNLIVFDPKRDLTVMPWICQRIPRALQVGDLLSGFRRPESVGVEIEPCNIPEIVYGKLGRSGVGPFDESLFTTYETVASMAEKLRSSSTRISFFGNKRFSAVLVRLAFGATPEQVRFAIARLPGVKVITAPTIVTSTRQTITALLNGIAALTLNRPARLNALSAPILEGLLEALPRLETDPAIGVIVLTGAGRAFCSGGDVKSMVEASASPDIDEAVRRLRSRMEVARLLHEIGKPTIAMVNGVAAGAGLSLALACDVRIAAQSARFITAFAKMGFSGDFGGSYFLSKLVGAGKARELYYTSGELDAEQALALGVVNKTAPDEQLSQTTMTLARRLAQGPRIALRLMKQNFNAAESGTFGQLLDLEARHQIESGQTEDHREAARAFVEKRAPMFHGR